MDDLFELPAGMPYDSGERETCYRKDIGPRFIEIVRNVYENTEEDKDDPMRTLMPNIASNYHAELLVYCPESRELFQQAGDFTLDFAMALSNSLDSHKLLPREGWSNIGESELLCEL